MRIGFFGHSYHRTTGSSRFLVDALRTIGEVDEVSSGDGQPTVEPLGCEGYDAIIVWQMESIALRLSQAGHPNVTFFPMYDSCHAYPDSYWRRLSAIKVVSFSSSLHARLQRLGVRVRHARFWPEIPLESAGGDGGLAGFFWQRQQDVTWATIRELLGTATFERFTIHDAVDPGYGALVSPSVTEAERFHIRTTRWFPTRLDARTDLLSHNVYFAPRLREGIGLSFLEAMALGFLVVAPDRPTMNEYIVSGVNGLLYDPQAPAALDFTRARELGHRARREIEAGHERWRSSLPLLLQLIATPTRDVPRQAPLGALDPHAIWLTGRSGPGGPGRPPPSDRGVSAPRPPGALVTIVLDPGVDLEPASPTLASIAAQDWPHIEVIAVGDARAGTASASSEWHEGGIESWSTIPDRGDALSPGDAVDAAAGQYVAFLGPGETFPRVDTLSEAVGAAPADTEVIVGHHLSRDESGTEELRAVADPSQVYLRLRSGELSWTWIEAVPPRPAILWRAELLRRLGFACGPPRLVHEATLLRALKQGARVHHALACLASCPARRFPIRDRLRTLGAWREVAAEHTDRPERLDRAIDRMRAEARGRELHRLPAVDLVLAAGRVPGVFREIKRRVRTRRALAYDRAPRPPWR